MTAEPKKTPTLKLYIPLFIALVPSLAMAYLRSIEMDCLIAGVKDCGIYKTELKLVFVAISVGLLVSYFAFRRTIVIAIALLTIAWNLFVSGALLFPIQQVADVDVYLTVFVIWPLIAAAGIAIKMCLWPVSNNLRGKGKSDT